MNADTKVELDALHQAVLDKISAQFPAFQTVSDYVELRTDLALPACLVELEDFEAAPDVDPGTEQLAVLARWRARLVIGFRTEEAQREIRKSAAALAVFIHSNRWGLPVGPAAVTVIAPDDFEPVLDQFVVWSVEFEQVVHLGESVWGGEGVLPEQVLVSWVPDVGSDNEGEYQDVTS
jgi:hypothetical protein